MDILKRLFVVIYWLVFLVLCFCIYWTIMALPGGDKAIHQYYEYSNYAAISLILYISIIIVRWILFKEWIFFPWQKGKQKED